LIYIFAVQWKARFSFKIQRKSRLKIGSANWKRLGTPERALPRRRARPRRHATVPASGAHDEAPEWPPVTALRRWEPPREARGKWTVLGGANPPAGAPPVPRHWPPERRTSPAMPWPLHACVCHRREPTSSQPTFRECISQSSVLPRAHTQPPSNSATRYLCRLGELTAPPASMAIWARLNLPLAPLELTRVRVGLTKLLARRSPHFRGRRRITIAELAPPPILQAQGPT
jgi:hypothetical protein